MPHSRSRARKHPPERISQTVTQRIIQMRDEPLQGERLPRSSRTIYRIWQQAGRIAHWLPHLQEELSRPAPMSHWQLDTEGRVHRAR